MNQTIISTQRDRGITNFIDSLPRGRNFSIKVMRTLRKGGLTWDPWILKDNRTYRLFYLVGPKVIDPLKPWWTESTIYGATSTDMKQWTHLGKILEPTDNNSWESQRMLAGFAHKENGTYYLFYSASGKQDMWNEEIGLATSNDGIHWQRYCDRPLFSNMKEREKWYGKYKFILPEGEKIEHRHWRDPYIVKDSKTNKYYMFICAAANKQQTSPFSGCVGLAVADSIAGPYEILPPACMPFMEGTNESIYIEMERPQVIYKNGKYHLLFSCWPHRMNPQWLQQVGKDKITASSLYHFVSDQITGPFKPVNNKPVVIGSEKTGMYGTNFVSISNNSEEMVAYGWFHNILTLGISPLLFNVSFDNDSITIKI